MTKEELAAQLHGRPYRKEITRLEAAQAAVEGLVVVFGASDDLMELRGAIHDELEAFGGSDFVVTPAGLFDEHACPGRCRYYEAAVRLACRVGKQLTAVWHNTDSPVWTYETTIPHATFDIVEDGEVYCRGIVFALADCDLHEEGVSL